jgi:hypothetical protein
MEVVGDGSGDSSAASQQLQSSQCCGPEPVASQHVEPLSSLESLDAEQQPAQQLSASTVASAAACGTANPQVQADSIGCRPAITAIATRATDFLSRRRRVERRMGLTGENWLLGGKSLGYGVLRASLGKVRLAVQ